MPPEPLGRPPVFRFVGHSGTGKTTLLERLIERGVARGLRIAALKDTHHQVELDRPGKDTWRYARAGAEQVVLSTDQLLAQFRRLTGRASLDAIVDLLGGSVDLVLAEGFRQDRGPAVVVWRAAVGSGLPEVRGPVVAVVADRPLDLVAPRFDFDQVEPLLDFLLGQGDRP